MLHTRPLLTLLARALALTLSVNAHADGDGGVEDEVSEHSTGKTDIDHVATQVGGSTTRVDRDNDGHYEVTLANGTTVAVRPTGNTRVHKKTQGLNTSSVDRDGHLLLQTADGYELTVEPASHNDTDTRTILSQNGLSGINATGGTLTATRRDGSRLHVEADYQVTRTSGSGVASYREDSTGVDIDYTDGTRQRFHGVAPDANQLRTSAQTWGYTLRFNSDGSVDASSNGVTRKVKLAPTLTQGTRTQAGLRLEAGKVVMQYQDGTEQEVVVVQ
jgi:hypothetical protein